MPQILRALPWAIAILAIALLGAADIIPADVATSLVTVLPLVMVAIFAGSARCRPQEG
ncbi:MULTISPECIES: hypothetical protein [unclassified Sphingopyxis]|jgi:hypothetical protein|uniref:hypothetical protein n=1 Tax=unclassified Sphingopyxis TaxID=2614943 RepID=UPI0025F9E1FC|nr:MULTISPECIES: hypothetical protein [unclassified Sphingopyxis]